MPRRHIHQPSALADLGPDELEEFLSHRERFIQDHPDLGDLLKRAGNEYLAIGWRMHFDGAVPLVPVAPRKRRRAAAG